MSEIMLGYRLEFPWCPPPLCELCPPLWLLPLCELCPPLLWLLVVLPDECDIPLLCEGAGRLPTLLLCPL